MNLKMTDVAIIGAGVSGSAIARELSKYQLRVCVIEKEADVCGGTSKANSGIVHAGYDARPGSLMAKLNVMGNRMMMTLSKELDFSFSQNGSMVVCTEKEGIPELERLYQQGITNGVKELCIMDGDAAREMEPNLSGQVVAALYAPTAGIVCPFELNIALAENAAANGVEFLLDTKVQKIHKLEQGYRIQTTRGDIGAKVVVNAAGVYADQMHNMVSENKLQIIPRRGDYCLLDKSETGFVTRTIFQLPSQYGKGVLVAPTVHGNIIVGPTAIDIEDKEGTNTTREGLEEVIGKANFSVSNLPIRKVITSFAGLRAHQEGHEFIIEEVEDAKGFIDCAGIESPGLTSAPAVGQMAAGLVVDILMPQEKETFTGIRKGVLNPRKLTQEQRNELIRTNPAYGTIICRCEMITEGEIIDAIHRPLGARTLDGIKRRTRTGMGRCQAGFCTPRTMEILSRELGVAAQEITKAGGNSRMLMGINKDTCAGESDREVSYGA